MDDAVATTTPLVQLRLPDAKLVLAKLRDYAAGQEDQCEANDAIAAVEEAIELRFATFAGGEQEVGG